MEIILNLEGNYQYPEKNNLSVTVSRSTKNRLKFILIVFKEVN